MIAARFTLLSAVLLLSACGSGEPAADPLAERDPAVTAALADPLMADPDLTSQNRGNAALTGGGPAAGEIPPFKRGQAELDAARAAALELAGGGHRPATHAPAGNIARRCRHRRRAGAGLAVGPGLCGQVGLYRQLGRKTAARRASLSARACAGSGGQ